MSRAVAVITMLHETAETNSATRAFRGMPVLEWTLSRLSRSRELSGLVVVCWEDQARDVENAARRRNASVFARPRQSSPQLDAISAALRWSDGWRGGLLGTCHFDAGFDGKLVRGALADRAAKRVVFVEGAAGLVDPVLVDEMVRHTGERPEIDLHFTQAAPGLAPVVLSRVLLERLADAAAHPGRLLSYSPDTPGRDPITSDGCVPVPHPVARTLERFTLNAQRQIARLERATACLNGQLIQTNAEGLVGLLGDAPAADEWPRELTIELTARRATRPVYSPATHLAIGRGDMPVETARRILDQIASVEDVRVTFAGVGDPLLHPQAREIVEYASAAGIRAIHVETDLIGADVAWLATSPLDVLSVHVPAVTPSTYQRVMGVDGLAGVMENLKTILRGRRSRLPIIVPTFSKCRLNLDEMEAWYDQWLRAVGAAAIVGPSDCAGQIPDTACADMAGPLRRPCRRLRSRMTVLSDGAIMACEEDVMGKRPLGRADSDDLMEVWQTKLGPLRAAHERGDFAAHPLCGKCREWHRP